jgi:pimeloyl-ACP methyl ester carboxylesterase
MLAELWIILGAYISAHYAIAHPERVDKLILLSPVGLTSSSAEEPDTKHEEALVDAIIGYIWCKWQITPLALARAVGPILLPRLIKAFVQKTNLFATVEPNDRKALWQYIYSLVRVKSSMEYLMPLCIRKPRISVKHHERFAHITLVQTPVETLWKSL